MKKRLWLLTAAMLLALCLFGCKAKIDDPARYLNENAQKYGYSNALSELTELSDTQLEDAGFLRLQQNYRGIPVYGRTVVYVTDERGEALTMTGNVLDVDETLNLSPSLSPADAMALLASQREGVVPEIGEDDLCIYNLGSDGASHLAYQVNWGGYEILLDAHSGEVLMENTLIQTSTATSAITGQLTGTDDYTDVTYSQTDSGYSLYDPIRKIDCCIAVNVTAYSFSDGFHKELDDSPTVAWIDGESPDVTAVDAFVTTQRAYDFFSEVLYHQSASGEGNVTTAILTGAEYVSGKDISDNAGGGGTPSDQTACIIIGSQFTAHAASLDIIAHEYTHGVEDYHSNMVYSGESGAVTEGICDIFGELAEGWFYKCSPDWVNHKRNMRDPSLRSYPKLYQGLNWGDPTDIAEDNGNIHKNSTVISHAAYLMSESGGGLLTLEELANLWYRAMLMMPATCTFSECRDRVEWAALTMSELSDEKRVCISEAFDRVGIPSSRIVLAPQGKLTVLDRLWMPYDNYSISIWYYDVPDPEDSLLPPNDIALKLLKTEEVTSAEPYIMDLRPGFYVVELTDGADSRKKVDFELFISSTGPAEKEMETNFGACPLRVEVYSLGTVAEGATVTAEIDGEQFSAVTDEFGACTFILPETAREIHLTAHKDGLGKDTAHMTLTENDLMQRCVTAEPLILPPPYGEIVTQYERIYGTTDFYELGWGNQIIKGVFYLDLLDFDADGSDELVMCYGAGQSYDEHFIEVWTMTAGEPVMVHRDVAMHGSDISQYFLLKEQDGKWYVGSGWYGYEADISYYGLAAGEMYKTVSFGFEVDEDSGKTAYTANGKTITSTEFRAYSSLWYDGSEYISCLYVAGNMSEGPVSWRRHIELTEHTAEIRELLGINSDS